MIYGSFREGVLKIIPQVWRTSGGEFIIFIQAEENLDLHLYNACVLEQSNFSLGITQFS